MARFKDRDNQLQRRSISALFQSAFTNADLKFKAIFDQVQASRVDSFAALEHAKQALKQGLADITLQAQHYSDLEFDYRWTKFEWPVFGSARAGKVETAEAYFDVCGNILARLAPRAVKQGGRSICLLIC